LIPVNGQPFIYWQLSKLAESGITDVYLCLSTYSQQIIDYLNLSSNFGLNIVYCYEHDLLGTGGSVAELLAYNENLNYFFVQYGDSYLNINYASVQRSYESQAKHGLMTIYKNNGLYDKSNVWYKNNKIMEYNKKSHNKAMEYIDYGLGVFDRYSFKGFDRAFSLGDVYNKLLKDDQLAVYEESGRFYEAGSFEGIKDLEQYLQEQH
jgi:NDP-sugar pyrophosphorylase family protein